MITKWTTTTRWLPSWNISSAGVKGQAKVGVNGLKMILGRRSFITIVHIKSRCERHISVWQYHHTLAVYQIHGSQNGCSRDPDTCFQTSNPASIITGGGNHVEVTIRQRGALLQRGVSDRKWILWAGCVQSQRHFRHHSSNTCDVEKWSEVKSLISWFCAQRHSWFYSCNACSAIIRGLWWRVTVCWAK